MDPSAIDRDRAAERDFEATAVVEEVGAFEGRVIDEAGHVVEVTIARPGVSNNGYGYAEAVLRDATPLWEGAPAFLDHPTALDLTRAGARSLRDLVGIYEGARYEQGQGIRARLRLNRADSGAFGIIREAIAAREAGRASLPVGISADWRVLRSPAPTGADGRPQWQVHAITAVNSGDLVVRPSAGGTFDRILEAGRTARARDEAKLPAAGSMVRDAAGRDEERGMRDSEMVGTRGPVAQPPSEADSGTGADGTADRAAEVAAAVEAATRAMREQLSAQLLEGRLAVSGLPTAAQAHLRGQFAGRIFEATEIDGAIGALRGMLGEVFGQASIRGVGVGVLDPGQPQGITAGERIQAAFDRLFGIEVPSHLQAVPRLSGIREAYIAITGDKFFSGQYHREDSIIREANEVTTSSLSNVVLNSMTKRLVTDYAAQPKWWEPIVVKVGITDLKQQHRIRLNDFAALSTVSENAAYTNLAWGDAKENYTPTKRGNLVQVTLESFLNDDLHAITRIPAKVAVAAATTVNEFVAGLFTTGSGQGPTMADTYKVFDATNHQGNLSTATPGMDLSSTSLQTAMIALEKMQNSAGKRIGVRGRYLLVPPDLRWLAQVITQSQFVPGSANNDINALAGVVIPIVVPQFTTAYQWYLLADPRQVESIELGFLNGREEPELLVQDAPAIGSVFTNDVLSYKVRHIYGGGWLDYRGAFAALPTS